MCLEGFFHFIIDHFFFNFDRFIINLIEFEDTGWEGYIYQWGFTFAIAKEVSSRVEFCTLYGLPTAIWFIVWLPNN